MATMEDLKIDFEELKKQCLSLEEVKEWIKRIQKHNVVMKSIPDKPILADLSSMSFDEKLAAIQKYINEFEYNFTNLQLSTYQKKKTFASMVDYGKLLIKKSLPIRCLDGFILAAYLTCDIDKFCIRFPLRFMSKCENKTYWHIVLGIKHSRNNKWGSIGISRKNEHLSFKECEFDSLLDLIYEFIDCYKMYAHTVRVVTIGVPLTTNVFSEDPIFWDILQILNKHNGNDIKQYEDVLNQIFGNFIQHKDEIIWALTNGMKPYLFDQNVMFHEEKQHYYMKKQYEINEKKKDNEPSPTAQSDDILSRADDINRV